MLEWNWEKNDKSTTNPFELTSGSNKKVWWRCFKGHEWQTSIANRTKGKGCPYCSNQKVMIGENDLETTHPEIAVEWDYEKNYPSLPNQVVYGSHKKVWWKCSKGHEWQTAIINRVKGTGCPYCSGRMAISGTNDLTVTHPKLANEWDYEKNYPLHPSQFLYGSGKKVWWKCSRGHEWQARIHSRSKGTGCPYCSGRMAISETNDLTVTHPKLANEWDYEKNYPLHPSQFLYGSGKKVWWKCSKGHEWQASIINRSRGTNCPICSQETQTSFPEQVILYYADKYLGAKNRFKIEGYELDVFIPMLNLGIEYDGILYHTESKAQAREKIKNEFFKRKGINLIRIKESSTDKIIISENIIFYKLDGLYKNLNTVVNAIFNYISKMYNISFENLDVDVVRDTIKILQNYKIFQKNNSILIRYPELAKEWNYDKNKDLNPNCFDSNSKYKVWWKCSKGHEWQARIYSRSNGNGCPYCAGIYTISGENDIKTLFPNLMIEWNYEKNIGIKPEDISAHSEKKVWWKCLKGHEWQAQVGNRVNGTNCPYCAGKKVLLGFNDLETWCLQNNRQDLINEFDSKNSFLITDITAGSSKKVWWKCSKGHSYQTYLTHRTKMNTACPYCGHKKLLKGFNDLETTHPEIAAEWDYKKNKGVTPKDVMAGSNIKKYYFICKYNHAYVMTLLNRKKLGICPVCKKQKS